ncbi:hypothetical protein [Streptomyces sp. N50]|uniref:hypothetical protein n=1 Tax=Streptomyces sp. N50 TaxID=3081765 RepID=UPI002962270B|nr:hypothetical protein [Streptomyces sp. N50]WOX11481.1 hypothetical protein R2B38_22780 [Streptomyces sp. N50]
MDQSTREQLLYAEAAKHGVSRDQIHRAVSIIAAVQRRDRQDYRTNFGGELTPDRWLAGYGVAGFEDLCAKAAQEAGLGDDNSVLIMRIVSAIAPRPELRDDDRPVHFWARPLADPSEAEFPAYRVTYDDPKAEISTGFDWSGALLRTTLRASAITSSGAASLEESTGLIVFTDPHLPGAYIARPAPKRARPVCVRCAQWEGEHTLHERFGACPQFTTTAADQPTAVPVPPPVPTPVS